MFNVDEDSAVLELNYSEAVQCVWLSEWVNRVIKAALNQKQSTIQLMDLLVNIICRSSILMTKGNWTTSQLFFFFLFEEEERESISFITLSMSCDCAYITAVSASQSHLTVLPYQLKVWKLWITKSEHFERRRGRWWNEWWNGWGFNQNLFTLALCGNPSPHQPLGILPPLDDVDGQTPRVPCCVAFSIM